MPHGIPDTVQNVHLMAICGTGMGAFAGLLQDAGFTVRGSDAGVYPPMSTQLEAQGIGLMSPFDGANLDWQPDLVVVGNAIRKVNPENEALLARDLPYCSFPEALGSLFLDRRHSIVVAGTHGKTTTCSLMAWTLEAVGEDPGFLVGGVLENFGRNQRPGHEGGPFVVEGDEYDTAWFDKGPKFLHYRPRTCILTSVEFDHADIYRDLAHVQESFRKLVDLVPPDGALLACADGEHVLPLARHTRGELVTYGVRADADWMGEIVDADRDGMSFRIRHEGVEFGTFRCMLVGEHNLANLVAVIAVLARRGHGPAAIAEALTSYRGVRRRQTVFAEPDGVTLIDDFGHHPTAVQATIAATRLRFPGRPLWAVFEPRTNTTRRNVFQREYGRAFDGADRVLIAPVHNLEQIPAEERFDPARLAADIAAGGVSARLMPGVDAIVQTLAREARPGDVVLLLSNGGFGGIYDALPPALRDR